MAISKLLKNDQTKKLEHYKCLYFFTDFYNSLLEWRRLSVTTSNIASQ